MVTLRYCRHRRLHSRVETGLAPKPPSPIRCQSERRRRRAKVQDQGQRQPGSGRIQPETASPPSLASALETEKGQVAPTHSCQKQPFFLRKKSETLTASPGSRAWVLGEVPFRDCGKWPPSDAAARPCCPGRPAGRLPQLRPLVPGEGIPF